MRVVCNTLATLQPKSGVGHYAACLAAGLARLLGPDLAEFPGPRLAAWLRRGRHSAMPAGGGRHAARRLVAGVTKSMARAGLGVIFRHQYPRDRVDLYHEPNFLPFATPVPTIITVHDLSVILHPEWHPADRVRRHENAFRAAVERAVHVITVSETVRGQMLTHCGLASTQVTAVHNGVGAEFLRVSRNNIAETRRRLGLPDRYLLYVGTVEPRKNLLTLLKAYCDLPTAIRERCPLILAGGWGWKADDVADFYRATAQHHHVKHLGYVADEHRPGLFAGARALAFPSHDEGFGLPPLEMLASGGAVLASDILAHREVLRGHAHFVSPGDFFGWRTALARAATDDDWTDRLRRDGRGHAVRFTWEAAAAATAAVYGKVMGVRRAA